MRRETTREATRETRHATDERGAARAGRREHGSERG